MTVLNTTAATLSAAGVATFPTSALAQGSHSITASYNNDSNYNPATSAALTQKIFGNATIVVTSSANPQTVGGSVTLTATAAAVSPATGTPAGTVTFSEGGTALGAAVTLAGGVATLTLPSLAFGSHSITAAYAGDPTTTFFNPVSTLFVQVIKGNTSTAVSSSANPQDVGGSVTFTATVTASSPATGTPTGTVTFADGGTALGAAVALAGGQATFVAPALAGGSHAITATYNGDDPLFIGSTSTTLTQIIRVPTLVAVTSSGSPDTVGDAVTLTATVSGGGAAIPSGTVEFFDGAADLGGALLVGGIGSLSTTDLAVGDHLITAVYAGDGNFIGATSAPFTQTINKATVTAGVVATPPTSIADQSVQFNVTLSASVSSGAFTGTVSFFDGATLIGGPVSVASGAASFSTATLAPGTHTINVTYSGDGNHGTASASTSEVVSAITTTTVLTSSVNPSVFGQATTLTATVTTNGTTATGSVTFRDGGNMLGVGPVAVDGLGVATLNVSSLTVGSHTLTADYAGPAKFNTSSATAITQTVHQAGTTTTVATSSDSAVLGTSVTFTATVSGLAPGAGTPTGSVTFSDGTTVLGMGTLGAGVATFTTSTLAIGTHTITASYAGDTNFTESSSSGLTQTIAQQLSTTTLMSAPNPQTAGGTVTFTATVTGSGGTPTGNVTFLDGSTSLGSVSLSGGGPVVFSTAALTPGTHSITAHYAGDGTFTSSTSPVVSQVINQATAAVSLGSTPNPSIIGGSVRFDATVTATAGGAPTGTVTFTADGATLGTAAVGSGSGSGAGVATFSTSTLALGTHTVTATYGGDTNHSSAAGSTSQVVNPNPTNTALTSSIGPSVFGQPTTLTATVTVPGGTVPTGNVTFKDGTTSLGTGAVQLNASGVATLNVATLSVGSHSLTAAFAGSANFAASTSPAVTQLVGQAATSTALATSSSSVLPDAMVTFTATVNVSAPGAGTPTGTVTFSDGTTVLGTAPLAAGLATFSTSTLIEGSHTITAAYGGDASFQASTSLGLDEEVSKTAVTAALVAAPTASTYGQDVTFTATLSAAAAGTPTGSVSFGEGTTALGTGTLDATGAAAVVIHTLAAGTHTITATYAGDALHAGGSTASLSLAVNKRSTTTALDSAPNPSTLGDEVTLTATTAASVTPAISGSGADLVPLGGTVTFKDGTTTIGSATLASDGTAMLVTGTLEAGSHMLSATYEGADDYATSSSPFATQQVLPPAPDGGADSGTPIDGGGALDGASPDGGTTVADAAPEVGATSDAASGDGMAPADAGAPDHGGAEVAASDAGGSGKDAGSSDASNSDGAAKAGGGGGGCGCRLADADRGASDAALLGLFSLALVLTLRRRRRS